MSTVNVWPNPEVGATVTLESTYVITSAGAAAELTSEIAGLLRERTLLDHDPSGVNPNPSPIPPNDSGLGLVFENVAAMLAYPASTPNQAAKVLGYHSALHGGGGDFTFYYGDATAADGGTVFPATLGRWKRDLGAADRFRNVKWFGAYGDDSHNDTDAIQATIDSLGPYAFGCEVFLPHGTYKLTDTLRWECATIVQPGTNGRLRGENAGNKSFPGVTLKWYGPSTHPTFSTAATSFEPLTNGSVMFQFNAFDSICEGINFVVAEGYHCGCLVNLGYDQGAPVQALNQMQFLNCSFTGGSVYFAEGSADYGIVWDYWKNGTDENTEDCRIIDCQFARFVRACAWFRLTTQPYGTVFQRCFMHNSIMVDPSTPGWTGNEPYGIAFQNDTLSLSLTVQDCDIQRCATHFYVTTHPQCVKVINCHSERCKKIWFSGTGAFYDLSTVSFDGGRHAPDGIAAQSYGPTTSWGPADDTFFFFRGDHPVSIRDVSFQAGYAQLPFKISTMGNDLFSAGNRYPNATPFTRIGPFEAQHIGREFSSGDTGTDGAGVTISLPTLRGAMNPGGTVTISGAATSASVVFARPESTFTVLSVALSQSYRVALSVQGVTGAAVVTAPYLSAYLNTGFTVSVPTAPGVGNSVTVAYEIYR